MLEYYSINHYTYLMINEDISVPENFANPKEYNPPQEEKKKMKPNKNSPKKKMRRPKANEKRVKEMKTPIASFLMEVLWFFFSVNRCSNTCDNEVVISARGRIRTIRAKSKYPVVWVSNNRLIKRTGNNKLKAFSMEGIPFFTGKLLYVWAASFILVNENT